MKFKRLFAGMTSFALCFSMLTAMPVTAEDSPPGEDGNALTNNDVSVSGTNSFGQMIARELDEKAAEQTDGNGCNVFSVKINEQTAEVELQTTENCTLIVAVYEDDGVKMLDSAMKEVTEEDFTAEVMFDEPLPEHHYLKAFLVDSTLFRPLSPVYTDPMHTAEMQEFLSKTTDDFDSDRVLNLDGDKASNFAVYNDGVIILDGGDGTLRSADEESLIYVFENVSDEFKGLKQGDKFAYGEADDLLIVCVDSIEISGDTVTVRGADAEMDDVFDFIKIESEPDKCTMTVDNSTLGEGVEFVGFEDEPVMIENSQNAAPGAAGNAPVRYGKITKAVEIEGSTAKSLNYKLEKKTGNESSALRAGISASANLKLSFDVNVYLSLKTRYIEFSLETSLALTGKINIEGKLEFRLAKIKCVIVPGVNLELTPSIVLKGEIEISFSVSFTKTIGFKIENMHVESISKKPNITIDLKAEGTLFIGLDLQPSLVVVSKKVADITLNAEAGIESTVTYKKNLVDLSDQKEKHTCKNCLSGENVFKVYMSITAKVLNLKRLSIKRDLAEIKVSLGKYGKFFYSFDHGKFGWGECPYKEFLFTIQARIDGAPAPNTDITLTDTGDKTYSGKTDKNGYYSVFVPAGKYDIKALNGCYEYTKSGKNVSEPVSIAADLRNISLKDAEVVVAKGWMMAAINKKGDLYTWGTPFGSFSLGTGDNKSRYSPVKIMSDVIAVSLSDTFGAFIRKNGDLYMWGDNEYGQLGTGDTKASSNPVKIMSNVKSVSLGPAYSACITKDGSLYMWGNNVNGQLGTGDTKNVLKPKKIKKNVKAVSLEFDHSACITKDGILYMWGNNECGKLGTGDTKNRLKPVEIMKNVKTVSLGSSHSACITVDNELYIWGANYFGQLGTESHESKYNPENIMSNVKAVFLDGCSSSCIRNNGELYIWGDMRNSIKTEDTNDENKPVRIADNIKAISICDINYSLYCITENGELYTCGDNHDRQLGTGDTNNKDSLVHIMSNVNVADCDFFFGSCACITEDGSLYTWGSNSYGQLGIGTSDNDPHPTPICITGNSNAATPTAAPTAAAVTQSQNAAPKPLDAPEFTGLAANTVYNVYAMKDPADGLDPDNLMYIDQFTADEKGAINFTYGLKENTAVKWLAVPMAQEDISAAEVILNDLDYTGEELHPEPAVTLDGETLVFGSDYCLEGDFAATEPGEYTLTVCGMGLYGGKKSVTYKIRSGEIMLGDLNKDEKIDVDDLVLMQKRAAGWKTDIEDTLFDVDASGNIDVDDLVLMQKKVAGWKVEFGKAA